MLDRMTVGDVPRKHHIQLRGSGGELRYEECITRSGFEGPYTICYHEQRPHVQQSSACEHGFELPVRVPRPGLAKRHYRTSELQRRAAVPLDSRVPLLFNQDLTIGVLRPSVADPIYFSNGDADDLYFVLKGSGLLRSALGDLSFSAGDYVIVPRGIVHRWLPDSGVDQYWLSIECFGGVGIPKQFRNELGQLRMDAPYCHRDFRRPEFGAPRDEGIRELVVKRGGAFHGFRSETSPLDVVGWDGSVYPVAFPILNFQPRAGLVHLPPTQHGTFAARGALICSFVPRPLDFHPEAIPCPYPHSNVDIEEVLFYASGDFSSRRGVGVGSLSHHPAGMAHGPHPGAYEASIGARSTSELAVMLDCSLPLEATANALSVEDAGYEKSFAG
jgi:homogentisate 1,2-dioxygenase